MAGECNYEKKIYFQSLLPTLLADESSNQGKSWSTNHHLLHLHVVALDEADHVDARGTADLHLVAAAEGLATDDVAKHVNHLDSGLTFDAEDAEVADSVDEAEGV